MKICEINYLYAEDTETPGNMENRENHMAVIPDSYEEVRTDVFAKLINTKRHLNFLEKVVNESFLDLSLVAYVFKDNDPDEEEIPITNEILERWGIRQDILFKDAVKNTRALMGERVWPMIDMIKDMVVKIDPVFEEGWDDVQMPMYVFTNLWKWNGAVCLLYNDTMKQLADMLETDLYVIPSSVHELILVPIAPGIGRGALDSMIREINRTELKPEDILSDHTYVFLRQLGKVIL